MKNMGKHWLDKIIKEQKVNRDILGYGAAELQEEAEYKNWDSPKKRKRIK